MNTLFGNKMGEYMHFGLCIMNTDCRAEWNIAQTFNPILAIQTSLSVSSFPMKQP